MEEFTTENTFAQMPMTHIAASGMTTIALSEDKPITDSTESDSEKNEFMTTVSCSRGSWITKEMAKLMSDFSALWELRIVESLGDGTYRVKVKMNSNDGLTGHSPEEAEHLDL